jgi:EAL domain-containing protein (putative c-di-GMP-specific phosphodiesterase class I)
LKALGFHLTMDDFGTGYSSLAYLKRFPFDSVKIDQSFVRGIPASRDDCAIVEAIIAMAHSLELKVVAEGVETQEQSEFLRELGCDQIQGYFFSKPIPSAEIVGLLYKTMTRSATAQEGS